MNIRRSCTVALVAFVGVVAFASVVSCASDFADAGQACEESVRCRADLECVDVDGDSVCLPRPELRETLSCESDDDCTRARWPVETECLDGVCRCLQDDIDCGDEDELVLEQETCFCVPLGTEGDDCITSHTCALGFACPDGECVEAPGEDGATCNTSSECLSGDCGDARGDLGICIAAE